MLLIQVFTMYVTYLMYPLHPNIPINYDSIHSKSPQATVKTFFRTYPTSYITI